MKSKKPRAVLPALFLLLLLLLGVFLWYVGDYYHAEAGIWEYCRNEDVEVTTFSHGLLLDGRGEDTALIFYPGAKVEYTAYVPLLSAIAEKGIDVFIVKMPFNLAFFGKNAASEIIGKYDYESWYISGHSLGGAMAAYYASDNSEKLDGIIFLASYTTKDLSESGLRTLSIYGSEDGILNRENLMRERSLLPFNCKEVVIEGGNHARFGLYGEQKGDGKAAIGYEEQFKITQDAILDFLFE